MNDIKKKKSNKMFYIVIVLLVIGIIFALVLKPSNTKAYKTIRKVYHKEIIDII